MPEPTPAATPAADEYPLPLGRPAVLQSFHYARSEKQTVAAMKADLPDGALFFLDSGAPTARAQGVVISPEEYGAFVAAWSDVWDVAITLDVHQDGPTNVAMLERLHDLGARVAPVFHPGNPWDVLDRYAERFPLVLLGEMVLARAKLGTGRRREGDILRWTEYAVARMARYGAVAHGLGQTDFDVLARVPFYSADSTSWLSSVRYGCLKLWNGRRIVTVRTTLKRDMTRHHDLLMEYGFDPIGLVERQTHYTEVASTAAVSYRRLGAAVRSIHGPVALRDGSLPAGFHLVFAGSPWSFLAGIPWSAA